MLLDLFPTSEAAGYEILVKRLVCLFGLGSSGTHEHQEPARGIDAQRSHG